MERLQTLPSPIITPLNRCFVFATNGNWPSVIESADRKVTRISAQTLSLLVGGTGNLVYYKMIKGFTNIEPLGWTFVVANTLGFGITTAGIQHLITTDAMKQHSPTIQRLLNEGSIPKTRRVAYYFLSGTGGIIATIPFGAIAHVYNNHLKKVYRDLLFTFVVASNCSLSIKSLELTFFKFDQLARAGSYTGTKKELYEIKQNLIRSLQLLKVSLATQSEDARSAYIQKIKELKRDNPNELDQVTAFLGEIKDYWTTSNSIKDKSVAHYAASGLGLLFAFGMLTHYWKGGWLFGDILNDWATENGDSSDDVEKNEPLQHFWAILTTFCNAYITTDLILNSIQYLFSKFMNLFKASQPDSAIDVLRSRTIKVIDTFSATTGALCFVGATRFSKDYFSGNFGKFVEGTAPEGVCLFITSGMMQQLKRGLNFYVSNYGSQTEKEVLHFEEDIDRLSYLIENCSIFDFAKSMQEWHAHMDPSLWNRLNLPDIGTITDYVVAEGNKPSASLTKHEHSPSPGGGQYVVNA